MIRLIAAIDSLRGIANEAGIPWDLPSDKAYYRKKVKNSIVLMGRKTYENHKEPISNRQNYVLTSNVEPLRNGLRAIDDIDYVLLQKADVWVLGGQDIYELMLPHADELFITQVNGMFNCTKYFPAFEQSFVLHERSKIQKENGILFQYQEWTPRRLASFGDAEDVETGSIELQ